MAEALKGIHIVISGVVQGVGFRWFVLRVAEKYGVKGFVRNLYDGSVEIVAEGSESTLEAFLDEVRIGPRHAHITGVKSEWLDYKGNDKEFRIRL